MTTITIKRQSFSVAFDFYRNRAIVRGAAGRFLVGRPSNAAALEHQREEAWDICQEAFQAAREAGLSDEDAGAGLPLADDDWRLA